MDGRMVDIIWILLGENVAKKNRYGQRGNGVQEYMDKK